MLMAAGTRRFQFEGKDYLLLVGIRIDENFIGNIRALTSLEIRLYYNRGSGFLEYYSFSSGTQQQERRLPDALRGVLVAGEPYIFDRGAEGGEFLGVYTPLFDAEHRLIAVVFCGSKKSLASGLPMATVLLAGQSVGLIVLPLMLFHQMQLMACAAMARHYAGRSEAATRTARGAMGAA